ncbi:addiction module antidote protein [Endozoicomonas sp. 8E]|uniref:addiction module antidote protein n=1 Tax=Endozoicomonas sp. 8E TaxID=3035692 RepID=UPI003977CA1A
MVRHEGIAQLAEQTGLNRESLYKTFNGKVQPRWDTVHRLLKALGVKLEIAA